MEIGAKGWVLVGVGTVAGVGLTLLSGAVRDAAVNAVDAAVIWWWDLVYRVQRFLLACGLLLVCGLAGWAVIALLLPRLAK